MDPIARKIAPCTTISRIRTHSQEAESVSLQARDQVHQTAPSAPLLQDAPVLRAVQQSLEQLPKDLQNKILHTAQLAQWEEGTLMVSSPLRRARALVEAPEVDDAQARFDAIYDVVKLSPTKLSIALCIRDAVKQLPATEKSQNYLKLLDLAEENLRAQPEASHAIIALSKAPEGRDHFGRLHALAQSIGNNLHRVSALAALARIAPNDALPSLKRQLGEIPASQKHIANKLDDAIFIRERDGLS